MRSEAKLRLRLEDHVQVNPSYKTLFDGLKLNTEHNSAIVEPLAFLIRRIMYAVVIVFMPHLPQVAVSTLLVMCLMGLAFSLTEKPWKDPEAQKLAIANEMFLYLVLVIVLSCSSISGPGNGKDILGWLLIILVTIAVHFNLIAIGAKAAEHTKLLYRRHQNRKLHLAKKQIQVAHSEDPHSEMKSGVHQLADDRAAQLHRTLEVKPRANGDSAVANKALVIDEAD